MEVAGLTGIFASLLGLALTVSGVFFNSRETRVLVRQLHSENQAAVAALHAAVEAGDRDTRVLIERTHQETRALVQTIHRDIEQMDRRHTELRAEIAKRP